MTETTKIFAFIGGGIGTDDLYVMAVCEDGCVVGGHVSSSEEWAKHDIGVTSTWHHKGYAEHCPDGFDVIWVDDVPGHEGLKAAYALNQEARKGAEEQGDV